MTELITWTQTQVSSPPMAGGLEQLVGNTPLLPLKKISAHLSPGVQLWAKAEWFNPSGSVKDRPALYILRTALAEGRLRPGMRLLDSTSGNMGIAYATLGAALDFPVTLALPANASRERITILRSLGAELVLTDASEGSDGAMRVARRMAEEQPARYYYANQYDNPANWLAHYSTTGPEIVRQTCGEVTHFVAGLGTSGTLTGAGCYLREFNPAIQVVAVQPDIPLHGLEGLKHMSTSIKPGIYDDAFADLTLEVDTDDAYRMVRQIARSEGLFVGISSGAAAAALRLAESLETGMVVTLFPDAGYKYLSERELWENKDR